MSDALDLAIAVALRALLEDRLEIPLRRLPKETTAALRSAHGRLEAALQTPMGGPTPPRNLPATVPVKARILRALEARPSTVPELCERLKVRHQTLSARVFELEAANAIYATGDLRDGARVLEVVKKETIHG